MDFACTVFSGRNSLLFSIKSLSLLFRFLLKNHLIREDIFEQLILNTVGPHALLGLDVLVTIDVVWMCSFIVMSSSTEQKLHDRSQTQGATTYC